MSGLGGGYCWQPGCCYRPWPTPKTNCQPPPPAGPLTLSHCLSYALAYQPLVRQARLDEGITDAANRVALSAWLPQVNAMAVGQHYFGLPFTVFPDLTTGIPTPRQLGVQNVTTLGLAGTQTIFNNDALLAARQAPYNRLAAGQNTLNNKIATVSDVSKSFYSVLLSQRPAQVFDEDIRRLSRNYQDARNRYNAGIVDKTDFLQAEISLNNFRAVCHHHCHLGAHFGLRGAVAHARAVHAAAQAPRRKPRPAARGVH
ncbi:MAG: TolC family protein [Janthinobacterium lividum]